MGTGKAKAQAQAKRYWNSSQGKRWQQMGAARCDVDSSHRIPFGQGYVCKPLRLGDNTPDLVCERCFDSHPYEAWDPACDEAVTAEAMLFAQSVKDALYAESEPQPGDIRRMLMGIGGLLCILLVLIAFLLKGICYLFGWAWLAWLSWLAIVIVLGVGLILIVGAVLHLESESR